ncbi:MAG TPA: alternative ribosome rescue aminoacyl-tRNA hydrolase ArfB [Caulobacteraceae bacterium]|nr:alternative ribosome rescue aminoacyl-tRNA hydrolase ArfB [Caulobacteraceae bacterium]
MIYVTDALSIDEGQFDIRAARASGPGGQHVNKTSSAIELRFDVENSPSLAPDVKARLTKIAGSRMTLEGELLIFAQSHRSQEMNRQDAIGRLIALIQRAAEAPKPRKKTRPTKASKERRLAAKTRRSSVKAMRGRPDAE